MRNYVGIDLGTTNSAIAIYDGTRCQVRKSTKHTEDVTPSAIYYGRRGGRYIGRRAYENSFVEPDRTALHFKRLLGTKTKIEIEGAGRPLTPEECSAEILRTLWGYLPEEVRNEQPGTIITTPAAFNQMQKNATKEAAEAANIGQIALLQEPVAAVMSILQQGATNGMFMVYDLGGGTLDIAVAEAHDGHVNLLAHGGVSMHGGKDWDRAIMDNVVKPWLTNRYNLPKNMRQIEKYKNLLRAALRRTEEAKIALSSQPETMFEPLEGGQGYQDIEDEKGEIIELEEDLKLSRDKLNQLIKAKIGESVVTATETLKEAGVTSEDIEKIVFVGGPTNYAPLREAVCYQLGIRGSTEVNPMTAVAEGAAIYAESVEWDGDTTQRKSSRGTTASRGALGVELAYTKRSAEEHGQIKAKLKDKAQLDATLEVSSEDTGWSSGRVPVGTGASIKVPLSKWGENRFVVDVRDADGECIALEEDAITIVRTAVAVEGIPASHSIGVEVQDRIGGTMTIEWLVRKGDNLPSQGTRTFRAGARVRQGSTDWLLFKLCEGESDNPKYNRPIGALRIEGGDFDDGQIEKGAELECIYSVDNGGTVRIEVQVPSISASFGEGRNFYAHQEGQVDLHGDRQRVKDEAQATLTEARKLQDQIGSETLDKVIDKLERTVAQNTEEADIDEVQEIRETMLEAQRAIGKTRQENRQQTRRMDLDETVAAFGGKMRSLASAAEQRQIDTLVRTAQEAIEEDDPDFEKQHEELEGRVYGLLWRNDGFVVAYFRWLCQRPQEFTDQQRFWRLASEGKKAVERSDVAHLRQRVLPALRSIQYERSDRVDLAEAANILRG